MKAKDFKLGMKVEVADCYLEDEVTENTDTSKVAVVESEPSDNEELVAIQYESGEIDFVPQNILEPKQDIFERMKSVRDGQEMDGQSPLDSGINESY